MRLTFILALVAIGLGDVSAAACQAMQPTIDPMPPALETRFALSALPPALRDKATVYLLDPRRGYHLSRQGTSGVACLVERTQWELADYRNDIYVPLCYDAAGTMAHLEVIMDAAALRAQGESPGALKANIEARYRSGTYTAPSKPGLAYMVAPIQRTIAPPDLKVHTVSLPHVMTYAPGLTNADIGAMPDLGVRSSLLHPFIDREGNAQQTYIIHLVGEAERARILLDEKSLLDDLCTYRAVLCLPGASH